MESGQQPALPRYVPEIDGLRAVAVLLVLVHHLGAGWLQGGFIGVDVFFTISGYVVSKSLAGTPPMALGPWLRRFYARRIVRILPALLLCLAVTIAATVLFVPQAWLSESIPTTALWAVFGAANLALIRTDDGYFAPRADHNPFTHAWSLGVEEQFYLLFPLPFLLWLRHHHRQGRWPWLGRLARTLMPALVLLSLAAAALLADRRPALAYYGLASRFWQIGAGVMLFQWHAERRPGGRRAGPALVAAGLALIALAAVVCRPAAVPFPDGLLPVLGTLLVLHGCGGGPVAGVGPLLRGAPARWLGDRSYGLYLWHWPVIVLLRWTVGLRGAMVPLAAGLSLLLAMASHAWLEQPLRQAVRRRELRPGPTIAAGLGAAALSFGLGEQAFAHQSRLTLSVTRDRHDWYALPQSSGAREPQEGPLPLAGRTLFVAGNSHAGAYAALLERLRRERGLEIRIHDLGLCAPGLLSEPVLGRPGCRRAQQSWLEEVGAQARPGDLVFLTSLRLPRFTDQWTEPREVADLRSELAGAEARRLRQQGQAETLALIRRLRGMGLEVVIERPKPLFRSPPFRCSDWFNRGHPICGPGFGLARADMEAIRAPLLEQIGALQRAVPGLLVWDPLPLLCPGSTCRAFERGRPLFFDGDHLSGHGNRVLHDSFLKVLERAWPPPAGQDQERSNTRSSRGVSGSREPAS